ncbi:MAG TPA: DUF4136 domain-containing protein [Galbitalea sp.]
MRSSGFRAACLTIAATLDAAMMQACETEPAVRSQYDKTADFGAYRTFNFVSPLATDKLGYSTLVTQTLKDAVIEQMQDRGYVLSERPDLLVGFSAKLEQKRAVRSTGSYYGYRTGLYSPWMNYSHVYGYNYREGTINIDFVDARRQQMVWEGVGMGEVSEEKLHNRERAIADAVANIFVKYPFRAGESQPANRAG